MLLWLPGRKVRRAAGAAACSLAFCSWALALPDPVPEVGLLGDAGTGGRPLLDEPRTVLFNSSEIGASAYSNTGFKRSLEGPLHQDGFVLMGSVGAGRQRQHYRQDDRRVTVDHFSSEGSLLFGHQWNTGRAIAAVLAGPEFDFDQPVIDGTLPALNSPSFGARLLAEVWAHPGEDTLAIGTLVLGTAPLRAWGRLAAGWRVGGPVFVGPEAVLSLEETYREVRFGIHVTGLQTGRWTFSLSGGLLAAEHADLGGYIGLTTVFKP